MNGESEEVDHVCQAVKRIPKRGLKEKLHISHSSIFGARVRGRQYKGGQRNYLVAQRRDVTSRDIPAGAGLGYASQPYGQCKRGSQ